MDRRVLLAIATCLSFSGVLGLYLYSCSIQPEIMSIEDIWRDDVGSTVGTTGFILDYWTVSTGDLVIELVDYESATSIKVYVPEEAYSLHKDKALILPGAKIQVFGEVREYMEELEMAVMSEDGLAVLQEPGQTGLTIEIIAKNPQLFLGREVSVHGQVQNVYRTSAWSQGGLVTATRFELRYEGASGNYTLDCLLIGMDVSDELTNGQMIAYSGTFEYRESMAKYQIVSDRIDLHS